MDSFLYRNSFSTSGILERPEFHVTFAETEIFASIYACLIAQSILPGQNLNKMLSQSGILKAASLLIFSL